MTTHGTWPPTTLVRHQILSCVRDIRDALNDRITKHGFDWSDFGGYPDPGGRLDDMRVLNYWGRLRRVIELLAPRFVVDHTASDWVAYSWPTLANATFGEGAGLRARTDWRNSTNYGRVFHRVYDLIDARDAIEKLQWMQWTTYEAKNVQRWWGILEDTFQARWDDALANGLAAPAESGHGPVMDSGVHPDLDTHRRFQYYAFNVHAETFDPKPDDVRIRLKGTRTISGAGANFALIVDGDDDEPSFGDANFGTFDNMAIATTASAGAGAFNYVLTPPTFYRYLRIRVDNVLDATVPFAAAAKEEASHSTHVITSYDHDPF